MSASCDAVLRSRRKTFTPAENRTLEYRLENAAGLRVKLISFGATLAELHVPDRRGELADVVLGFDDESAYHTSDNQHFGCTTGRVANRIAGGKFTLDGVEYRLALNNGPNHLHGGTDHALDKADWHGEPWTDSTSRGVRFRYVSPDGEEGYPGELTTTVNYALTDDGALRIEYEATTDRATPVNLTNHSYFNLAGHGTESVLQHELWVDADRYLPKDETGIPTGQLADVSGTPLDFRTPHALGQRIGDFSGPQQDGYDHNLVLNGEVGVERLVARLHEPASGRVMTVATDQPGMQLYTANFVWGQTCKQGRVYRKHSAVCLETQHFPDAPNQPHFPSIILRPGEVYRHVCVYAFESA